VVEGHSLPGEHRGKDKSEHRKNLRKGGALTFWSTQREGQFKTQKNAGKARATHQLEREERGTIQNIKL